MQDKPPLFNIVLDGDVSDMVSVTRKRPRTEPNHSFNDPFGPPCERQQSDSIKSWSPDHRYSPFRPRHRISGPARGPAPAPECMYDSGRPCGDVHGTDSLRARAEPGSDSEDEDGSVHGTDSRLEPGSDVVHRMSEHEDSVDDIDKEQDRDEHDLGSYENVDNLVQDTPDEFLDDGYEEMFLKFGHVWLAALVTHKVSITAASYLWRLAFQWIGPILQKKREEGVKGKIPQFDHLRRKLMKKLCPPVSIRACYKNLESGEVVTPPPSEVNHVKAFSDINKFQKLSEISSVKFKDVLKIHRLINPRHQQDVSQITVDLSCDGVADSKSSSVSMDMYTICLLYTSPSPRDGLLSRMPSSA